MPEVASPQRPNNPGVLEGTCITASQRTPRLRELNRNRLRKGKRTRMCHTSPNSRRPKVGQEWNWVRAVRQPVHLGLQGYKERLYSLVNTCSPVQYPVGTTAACVRRDVPHGQTRITILLEPAYCFQVKPQPGCVQGLEYFGRSLPIMAAGLFAPFLRMFSI